MALATVEELVRDFNDLEIKDRLNLLLEFSESLPALPQKYLDHPDLLERVAECQTPIYLFVEVDKSNEQKVNLYFTAPEESPTTRGFASVLKSALDGHTASEILAVDDNFPDSLGLTEAVSPLRMRGMRGMLQRIKRNIREKTL